MSRGRTERVLVERIDDDGHRSRRPDELIVEEPMEILLDGHRVTTTMRTPGHDFELAVGFCHTEGLLAGHAVRQVRYCAAGPPVDNEFNVVSVDTGGRAPVPEPRLGTTTSSCGLCGSVSIEELCERLAPVPATGPPPADVMAAVPDAARAAQELFGATGAVHAAASFSRDGSVGVLREDIGRHNAVDKVVGHLLLGNALPAAGLGLFVSGRASFEIVQKAWAAGFATVVAVSAPSALAVATAKAAGITLAGFVRDGQLNVYAP